MAAKNRLFEMLNSEGNGIDLDGPQQDAQLLLQFILSFFLNSFMD